MSIDFLKESQSTVLMSDAYSGYNRTVREINEYRTTKGLPLMISALCNDHSRRYFYNAQEHSSGEKALDLYEKIYVIEAQVQSLIANTLPREEKNEKEAFKLRQTMDPLFNQIYDTSCEILMNNTSNSILGQSATYYLNHH